MPQAFSNTPVSDVIVDDSFQDLIQYSSAGSNQVWSFWAPPTLGLDEYYNHTVSIAGNLDFQGATVLFTFQGTRVAVYGSVSLGSSGSTEVTATKSSYSVDGAHNSTLTLFANQTRVQFYQSDELPLDQHTLRIDIQSPGDGGYQLDWIEYNNTDHASVSSSTFSPTSSTSSPDASNTAPAQTSSKAPVGAIVGGVIGGLALITVLVLLLFISHRRRRRRRGVHVIRDGDVYEKDDDRPDLLGPSILADGPSSPSDVMSLTSPNFRESTPSAGTDPLLPQPNYTSDSTPRESLHVEIRDEKSVVVLSQAAALSRSENKLARSRLSDFVPPAGGTSTSSGTGSEPQQRGRAGDLPPNGGEDDLDTPPAYVP